MTVPLRVRVGARLGGSLVTALFRTTRSELVEGRSVEREIVETRVPAVFVLWHGRLLPCAYRYRNRGMGTLISRNRDGDYITRMIEGWGYRVVRGSTSRGGFSGLKELVRLVQQGASVALTPDGPRGPRQKMKLGPVQIARLTGAPIVPVTAAASRARYFGRWDRFLVPEPFAWLPCALGEPIRVDRSLEPPELALVAQRVEGELNRLTELSTRWRMPKARSAWVTVPRWWRGGGGPLGRLAMVLGAPAEALFRGGVLFRNLLYDRGLRRTVEPTIRVVSVGNLTVGGTGKTPFSAFLARRLREMHARPAIVLRGYGADEVLLHRALNADIPVFSTADRAAGVSEAERGGASIAILDDGFQHRRLGRHLDLVLVAAEQWPEPRRLLPRGPWREPIGAVRRADFLVITRKLATAEAARSIVDQLGDLGVHLPYALVHLRPSHLTSLATGSSHPLDTVRGSEVLAVTSLAEPAAFEEQLRRLGANVRPMAYPDHHDFLETDVAKMIQSAEGRTLVMSRKEAVKLRGRIPVTVRAMVVHQIVDVEEGADVLDGALRRAIQ